MHFATCFFHVISVSETWLHSDVSDALVALDSYFLIRRDREGRRGGGVACFVHDSLRVKVIDVSATGADISSPEYLILEIRLPNNESVLFASVYRRPKGLLLHEFAEALTSVSHLYKNIIIGGDLNCNLLSTNFEASHLRDLLSGMSMNIVHSGATYHTATADSWLDVLAVDDSDKVLALTKSESPFIAGHDLLELTLSLGANQTTRRSITRRNFRSIDADEFRGCLQSIMGSPEFLGRIQSIVDADDGSCVDGLCAELSGAMIEALDTLAPARVIVIKRPPARWLSEDLRTRLCMRNKLYKQARRSNCLLDYAAYRLFRNQLNMDIKRAKSEFHYNSLIRITDSAKLWRELARLGLIKQTLVSPLHFFTTNQLNAYFASISGAQLPCSYADMVSSIVHIPRPALRLEFNFSEIQPCDVYKIIANAPLHSYASGSDGIPLYVLRIAWPVISSGLTELFNRSLATSTFPSEWKRALIRPHSKIRNPQSPSDTRPIANLPELSKILEKIVASQIAQYLDEFDLLNPKQSAYRPGHNTQSALLRVCDDIRQGIDNGQITIMILFDFSKAFDTVPHPKLYMKLKEIGFSDAAIIWIFSYLTGRSQAVIDELGNISEWLFTSSGVPQGSVLGPPLFSLYINDIGRVLKYLHHMIFADDVQAYLLCSLADIERGLELVTRDANAIFTYAEANGLKLNPSKSKVIIFGSRANISNIDLSQLMPVVVNGAPIPFVSEVRNLGVILTSNLSWKKHISLISQKVHHALYNLKFNKNSLSTALRTKLVVTLIMPHIDYCCLVYHSMTDELNTRLQRLVNCCIRFIYNLRRDEHISAYRRKLGWLRVENRRLYFMGCQMYRILHMRSPSYLRELFTTPDPLLRRSERLVAPTQTFYIPAHRTATYRNSFHISAIYFWHSLPSNITTVSSFPTFKSLLRSFLQASELD
ncbi:uncharacterized protein LOC143895191 [Temnothorax americanus]|uniref:uncharacterized protein LOC143895191 n=1 Tax=Temnothorax americanus TaxID=1964332 RepID=UPI0040694064